MKARWLVGIGLVALLAGCGGTAAPASVQSAAVTTSAAASAAAAAPASGLTKMVVANGVVIPELAATWVAQDAGIFRKNGLDVDLRTITGGSPSTAALLSGELQIVNSGAPEVLSAQASGANLAVVGILAPVYSQQLEVPAGIKNAADLKGKTVGIAAVGATGDTVTRLGLRKLGLEPDKDVKITALGSQPAVTAAILSGAVDGGMASPPDSILLQDKGFHSLLDVARQQLPAAIGTVYGQRSFATGQHDTMQRYVDSLVQAQALIKHDKSATVAAYRKYLKLDDDRVLSTMYDFYSSDLYPTLPYPKIEDFHDAVTLLANNAKVQALDLTKILDPSFVQSAADRGLDR